MHKQSAQANMVLDPSYRNYAHVVVACTHKEEMCMRAKG